MLDDQARIAEIETLWTTTGYWLFNADTYLQYSSTEKWDVIPADRRDTRLFTSSNGCRYGKCAIANSACSNGSSIAAAFSRTSLKNSSISCGNSRGWKVDFPMPTPIRRNLPGAPGSGRRFCARMP